MEAAMSLFTSEGGEVEHGVIAENPNDVVAQYQVTRLRALWSSYKRIFQLTSDQAQTLDPSTFAVTNTFPYADITKVVADEKASDQFLVEVDRKQFVFKTPFRAQLLCQLFECISRKAPKQLRSSGPYLVRRVRKDGSHVDCQLTVAAHGIVETSVAGKVLQEYKFVNVSRVGVDNSARALFLLVSDRMKVFLSDDFLRIYSGCRDQAAGHAFDNLHFETASLSLPEVLAERGARYAALGSGVSVFDVSKTTRRHPRPVPRQLHITEDCIVEKDSSGFQYVSCQRVSAVYALVRSWGNPREFTIEYMDGTSRTYTCAVRDTLLATLLDIARAVGNLKAIVTGEISDHLRFLPRFADEDHQASVKDALFGSSSIEGWLLARVTKACKTVPLDPDAMETACRELNANVACPGVTVNTDAATVVCMLTGVLVALHAGVVAAIDDERYDNSRYLVTLLQTLYRVIPCVHGYRAFVEVKEVDTRLLLLQLMRLDKDFVSYWTLEVLSALCRCPLLPRSTQQEFVNKHTLLHDGMLRCLIDQMSSRHDADDDADANANADVDGDDGDGEDDIDIAAAPSGSHITMKRQPSAPSANPTPTAHLDHKDNQYFTSAPSFASPSRSYSSSSGDEETIFFPNSLVIISAATLLESIVSSKRDTSSPELINKFLDLLSDRSEVLIHMLRSSSFLIMENAAILMFILLKNRNASAQNLKELALSECLALKHFYNAVFSPSGTQRFISRFLVNAWMSGPEKNNPGKVLLCRMIPSGLVEYLKHAPITEEHRRALDEIEDDFYAKFAGGGGQQQGSDGGRPRAVTTAAAAATANAARATDSQARMRKRISAVLKERTLGARDAASDTGSEDLSGNAATTQALVHSHGAAGGSGAGPGGGASLALVTAAAKSSSSSAGIQFTENYRIMFHMMTRDHQLPDLIWNEQTRLELRSALETEIRNFDREQTLRGTKKVAWNYQQFHVRYESLRNEMQVGPIYIRYFLDAGESFLRSLENPSHVILFEKLLRRVLVNVTRNPPLSILCTRSLIRLYAVCQDVIGGFDDMLLIVKLLDEATDMELQHCLIDLLELLSSDDSNLHQLLDRSFVDSIVKYASLAHLNPDQIGNVLARATNNMLMLKNAPANADSTTRAGPAMWQATAGGPGPGQGPGQGQVQAQAQGQQLKRSLWIPNDAAGPRVWFVAPKGAGLPPPSSAQRGPFRVSELMDLMDKGDLEAGSLVAPSMGDEADDGRFDAVVDTGRWRELRDYFQLSKQMLSPGRAVYSPAEIATKSLMMLANLAFVHRSVNFKGTPFFPVPTSKRIMSDPVEHLAIFAQLLLSNDSVVVETAADLLRALVEFNLAVNTKLYLTGAFYFACRYTGNNFVPLARLFEVTHVQQSFHDSASSLSEDLPLNARSFLGNILPAAVVNILLNYGAERFANVFTGEFDLPEVIWNAQLRMHLVEMIDQHIGDFPARLRQFTLARYDFCPIPTIHYAALNREIYVYEYYLRNFCDEARFPDWPVGEPLLFLRETLQRWREEMTKGVVDTAVQAARQLLGFEDKQASYADLRKAYKTLARKYHPDKNPNGRQMFEKIRVSYELLSSVELQVTEKDMGNVVLLMKTQNILYRRFPEAVSDQKYPCFDHLISVLALPEAAAPGVPPVIDALTADLLVAGTQLVFNTCSVSPLNVREFVKAGGVTRLYEIISYALDAYLTPVSTGAPPRTQRIAQELLVYGMKAFTAVSNFECGQDCIALLCPRFADDLRRLLELDKEVPLAVENAVETVARCCSLSTLQHAFVHAGLVWKLIPMLLAFDGTLQGDYSDESSRAVYNQNASNMHAVLAAKALGRLAGVMFDELASPANVPLQRALAILLTQPLAKLLRNRRPWDLLLALNQNVEKTTMIWNVSMRQELLDFVLLVDRARGPGSTVDDLQPAEHFKFSALRGELCVGGVYVRIFNRSAATVDIDDPSAFAQELLAHVGKAMADAEAAGRSGGNGADDAAGAAFRDTGGTLDDELGGFEGLTLSDEAQYGAELVVEALRTLADAHKYIAFDIATQPGGVETVFRLLDLSAEPAILLAASQLLTTLGRSADFVALAVKQDEELGAGTGHRPYCVWRLLRSLCTTTGPHLNHLWTAAEGLASYPDGLGAVLASGGVIHMLGILFGVPGYANHFQNRLAAVSLLSKFLWNPTRGAEASAMLRRFLPEPMVLLLRSRAGSASLHTLDDVCENPELVWTAEMQGELRSNITTLLHGASAAHAHVDTDVPPTRRRKRKCNFFHAPQVPADYRVRYRQLDKEIFVGDVYIRLYMKQPAFRLSNPVFFLEKLVELWENAFGKQVPTGAGGAAAKDPPQVEVLVGGNRVRDQQALILAKEDFLTVLTSCIVCVLKSDPSLVEHIISWGFAHSLVALLRAALDHHRRGEPVICVMRLLHQLADRAEAVEHLAHAPTDAVAQIARTLDPRPEASELPKEAAFICELLKKVFQHRPAAVRSMDHLVARALQACLPHFLLEGVVNAPTWALAQVRSPSALRVHAVDTLKAMLAAARPGSPHALALRTLLDASPAWQEFKDQSHDLFITDKDRADHFLLQDARERSFAGLLTNGDDAGFTNPFDTSEPFMEPAVVPPPGAGAGRGPLPTATASTTSTSSSSSSAAAAARPMRPPTQAYPMPPPAPAAVPQPAAPVRLGGPSQHLPPSSQAPQPGHAYGLSLEIPNQPPRGANPFDEVRERDRERDLRERERERERDRVKAGADGSGLIGGAQHSPPREAYSYHTGAGGGGGGVGGLGPLGGSPPPKPRTPPATTHSSVSSALAAALSKATSTLTGAAAAAAATPSPTTALAGSRAKRITYHTVIIKGEHGLGLDLGKTKDGRVVVQRLKDFPPGVVNPASLAIPKVRAGDFVIGIGGAFNLSFQDTVAAIRSAHGAVELELERIIVSGSLPPP